MQKAGNSPQKEPVSDSPGNRKAQLGPTSLALKADGGKEGAVRSWVLKGAKTQCEIGRDEQFLEERKKAILN